MALERHLTEARAMAAMTVHGLGGVGKTQLVLEYAHRHIRDFDILWWVTADEPATIPGQLAALARRLGLPDQAEQVETINVLLDELRHSSRWLLIFDNAEDPRDLRPYWPSGGGHVLVTSRNPVWRGIAATLCLDVLPREEAVAFLRRRLDRDDPSFAAAAEALGDLPLALEQAAGYLEETDIGTAEYLKLLGERTGDLLALGRPATTEQTIATTWTLSLQRLREQAPAAEDLLSLCAFLGADDIPRPLFAECADQVPERLATAMTDPLTTAQTIGVLRRYALITTTSDGVSMHRLVQAVVRCQLDPIQEQYWTASALRLIRAAFPPEKTEHEDEAAQVYARLLPHALAVTSHGERLGVDPEATAWLLIETGSYLWQQAAHEQACITLERARVIAESGLGHDHPITARSLNKLGCVLGDHGDYRRSRTILEQAVDIRERLGPDCSDLAESLSNLAYAVEDLGDLKQARTLYERALAVAEERLGPTHRDTAVPLHNLACALRRDGDLKAARTFGERALAIIEAARGPDHPYAAQALNNLASVLADQGELDTARSTCERALAILETRLGPNHPTTARCLNNLARVLRDQGDPSGARAILERALDIRQTRLVPDHPLTAETLGDLAGLLVHQGEFDAACSLHERALTIRETSLGPNHPDTIQSRQSLATIIRKRPQHP
jgi:tetratricopeptide (TPR) repeat protein